MKTGSIVSLLTAMSAGWAVESAPTTVSEVIDGCTLRADGLGTVRLLYLAIPTAKTECEYAAAELKRFLPVGTVIRLWGPQSAFEHDASANMLAVIELNRAGDLTAQAHMIHLGLAAYTGSAKEVPVQWQRCFPLNQERAKDDHLGAWQTIPDWMASHATKEPIPDPPGVTIPKILTKPTDAKPGESETHGRDR